MIKAVLLDLDNTLYDYEKCNQTALDAVFDKLSSLFNKSKEEIKEIFYISREKVKAQLSDTASSHSRFLYLQKTIETLKGATDVRLTQDIHNLFWDTYLNQMQLFDGVTEFLKELKGLGRKVAIISDLTVEIQFRKLVKLGIDTYVDFVVTSEEAGQEKPAEPIFMMALEKLGLSKEDVIFVGDDLDRDVQGAKNFGIRCILVNKGNFKDVIESFKDLNSL